MFQGEHEPEPGELVDDDTLFRRADVGGAQANVGDEGADGRLCLAAVATVEEIGPSVVEDGIAASSFI